MSQFPKLAAILTVLAALAMPSIAAAEDDPSWTVSVDPLTTALGFVHVQVERTLGDSFSVYAGPHLRLFNGLLSKPTDDYLGVGAELGARYFFSGDAPRGFWVMARAVGAHVTTDAGAEPQTDLGGYASTLLGYTWIPMPHLVLAGGAGIQYIDYAIAGMGTEGLAPALHTNVGVAF